jgi:hypothetical protein
MRKAQFASMVYMVIFIVNLNLYNYLEKSHWYYIPSFILTCVFGYVSILAIVVFFSIQYIINDENKLKVKPLYKVGETVCIDNSFNDVVFNIDYDDRLNSFVYSFLDSDIGMYFIHEKYISLTFNPPKCNA